MKTENDMKIMETDPNAAVTGCKFRPQNRIPMNADRSAVICVVFFEEEGSRRRVFELKKKSERERNITSLHWQKVWEEHKMLQLH